MTNGTRADHFVLTHEPSRLISSSTHTFGDAIFALHYGLISYSTSRGTPLARASCRANCLPINKCIESFQRCSLHGERHGKHTTAKLVFLKVIHFNENSLYESTLTRYRNASNVWYKIFNLKHWFFLYLYIKNVSSTTLRFIFQHKCIRECRSNQANEFNEIWFFPWTCFFKVYKLHSLFLKLLYW